MNSIPGAPIDYRFSKKGGVSVTDPSFWTICSNGATFLKRNHQFPATATGSKLNQWFADKIKKATKGKIEIKIYWSNRLGMSQNNLLLLKTNAIDLAAMSASYFPDQLPFYSAPNSIPMGMDNICQASSILKAFTAKLSVFHQEVLKGLRIRVDIPLVQQIPIESNSFQKKNPLITSINVKRQR